MHCEQEMQARQEKESESEKQEKFRCERKATTELSKKEKKQCYTLRSSRQLY
jgi:hypothetical protein